MNRAWLCASICASALLAASDATAHDLHGGLSPAGLSFVAKQLPGLVPASVTIPEFTSVLQECPGDDITMTQRATTALFTVTGSSITLPSAGVVRLELKMNVRINGQAFLDNVYACTGSATCADALAFDNGKLTLDFSVQSGTVTLTRTTVDVDIAAATMVFSDCTIAAAINAYAKDALLGGVKTKLDTVANQYLAPFFGTLLASFRRYDGTLDLADFSVALTNLEANSQLEFTAEVDLVSSRPAASCVADTLTEPGPQAGPPPNLQTSNHLAVAMNLGFVDDAFYHIWRDGALCMDLDRIASFGLPLDPVELLTLLPGFPQNTKFKLQTTMRAPPTVRAEASADAKLSIVIKGLQAEIVGTTPDGHTARIAIEADATATATVFINPVLNALTLRVEGVTLDRLELDQDNAVHEGFDIGRLHAVARDVILPRLLASMADIPFTGPVFGLAGYHTILRRLSTSEGYLTAHLDLFRAPAHDTSLPSTTAAGPTGLVKPADAVVMMGGTDTDVPSELLQFKVTVDGVTAKPSFIRAAHVGVPGRSATYDVTIAAVDLAGNVDPTPAHALVNVDGIRPRVLVESDPVVDLKGGGSVPLTWIASDDLTPADKIATRVEVYEVLDDTDLLSTKLLSTTEIPLGQSATQLDLADGMIYRVVITVRDQAGNESSAYLLFDAGTGGGCGCHTNSFGASGTLLICGIVGLVALRRPRSRRRGVPATLVVSTFVFVTGAATERARAGGLFLPGAGPTAQARAGAFVARADDPTALGHNPAGFSKLDGTVAYFGINLVDLSLTYQRTGSYETTGEAHRYEGQQFPVISDQSSPQFGIGGFQALPVAVVATDFGRPKWPVRFAFGMFTPQGYADRSFPGAHDMGDAADPAPGPQRYDVVSSQIVAVQPSAAVAYRVSPKLDIGARVSWGVLKIHSRSAVWALRNYEETPNKDGVVDVGAQDNFVPTFGLGVLYRPHPAFELGLGYNSGTHVNAHGDASSALGDGVGLPGLPDSIRPVTGSESQCDASGTVTSLKGCIWLDSASTATVGGRWIAHDRTGRERADIELDATWENWNSDCDLPDGITIGGKTTRKCSDFLVVVDAQSTLTGLHLQPALVKHGFKDVLSLRLGGSYRVPALRDRLTLRGGLAYDTKTAPVSWTRLDLDGSPHTTVAFGAALDLGKVRVDVGGGVVLQPTRIVSQCKPSTGPDVGDAGCMASGESPIDQRSAPDPVQPLAGGNQQIESPFNAGTYRTHYILLSLGMNVRF